MARRTNQGLASSLARGFFSVWFLVPAGGGGGGACRLVQASRDSTDWKLTSVTVEDMDFKSL